MTRLTHRVAERTTVLLYKGHLANTHGGQRTDSGQNLRKLFFREREIKARRVKVIEFKGYNSKIVSADKDWREGVLKLDQFYLGFVLQSIWL